MTIPSKLRFAMLTMLLPGCAALVSCALANYRSDPIGALLEVPRLLRTLEEMKTVGDIKGSFVFQAVELLFPDGVTPDHLPPLSSEQLEQVNRFLALRISGIQKLASQLVATHPQFTKLEGSATTFARVKFLATGQPEAVVDADGVLLLDIRIVQSVLRAVIVHWQQSGGFVGSSGGMFAMLSLHMVERYDFDRALKPLAPTVERKAIDEFNTFHAAIRDAAPSMEIGIWLKLLSGRGGAPVSGASAMMLRSEKDSDLMDRAFNRALLAMDAQIAEQSRLATAQYAQDTFESALDFLIAHELAHRLLGHATARSAATPEFSAKACADWQAEEAAADEFATLVLVQRQIAESRAGRIREKDNGFEVTASARVPYVDGGGLFLSTAYQLAGFSDQLVMQPCTYPVAEQRLRSIRELLDIGDGANRQAVAYEGLLKGSWGRAANNARLQDIVGEERKTAPKGADPMRVERALQLIAPLLDARYRDRI